MTTFRELYKGDMFKRGRSKFVKCGIATALCVASTRLPIGKLCLISPLTRVIVLYTERTSVTTEKDDGCPMPRKKEKTEEERQQAVAIRAYEMVAMLSAINELHRLEAIPGGVELILEVDELGLALFEYKELKAKLRMDQECQLSTK